MKQTTEEIITGFCVVGIIWFIITGLMMFVQTLEITNS